MRPRLIMTAMALATVAALAAVLVTAFAGAGVAVAQQTKPAETKAAAPPATAARSLLPAITKGKGDACVAPTDWMRRFHMMALSHKRDDTVHDGIRTPKFSLKGCIDCHAVSGGDGKPVTVKDERHFCRSCHDYAAVQVDCFECHASRPEAADKGAESAPTNKGAESAPTNKGAESAPTNKGAESAPTSKGADAGGPHGRAAHETARLGAALGDYLAANADQPKAREEQRP